MMLQFRREPESMRRFRQRCSLVCGAASSVATAVSAPAAVALGNEPAEETVIQAAATAATAAASAAESPTPSSLLIEPRCLSVLKNYRSKESSPMPAVCPPQPSPKTPSTDLFRYMELKTAILPKQYALAQRVLPSGDRVQTLHFTSATGAEAVLLQTGEVRGFPEAAVMVLLPNAPTALQTNKHAYSLMQSLLSFVSDSNVNNGNWTNPEGYYLWGTLDGLDGTGAPPVARLATLLAKLDDLLRLDLVPEQFWEDAARNLMENDTGLSNIEYVKALARFMFDGASCGSCLGAFCRGANVLEVDGVFQETPFLRKTRSFGTTALQQQTVASVMLPGCRSATNASSLETKPTLLARIAVLAEQTVNESMCGKSGRLSSVYTGCREAAHIIIPATVAGASSEEAAWTTLWSHATLLEHLGRAMGLPLVVDSAPNALQFYLEGDWSLQETVERLGFFFRAIREGKVPPTIGDALRLWLDSTDGSDTFAGFSSSRSGDINGPLYDSRALLGMLKDVQSTAIPSVDELVKFVRSLPLDRAMFLASPTDVSVGPLDGLAAGSSSDGATEVGSSELAGSSDLSNNPSSEGLPNFSGSDTLFAVAHLPADEAAPGRRVEYCRRLIASCGVAVDCSAIEDVKPALLDTLKKGNVEGVELRANFFGLPLNRELVDSKYGSQLYGSIPLMPVSGGEYDLAVNVGGKPIYPVELRVYAVLPELQRNASLSKSQQAAIRLLLTRLLIDAGKKASELFALPHLARTHVAGVGRFTSRYNAGRRNRIGLEIGGQSDSVVHVVRSMLTALENLSGISDEDFEAAKAVTHAVLSPFSRLPSATDFTIADVLSCDGCTVGSVREALGGLQAPQFRRLVARNAGGGCSLLNNCFFEFETRGRLDVATELMNMFRLRARWVTRKYSPAEVEAIAAFQLADLCKMGDEAPPSRKRVVCVNDYGSRKTKLAVAGTLPRAALREGAQGGVELLRTHMLRILRGAKFRAPNVEVLRFGTNVVFVISAYQADLAELEKALDSLANVSYELNSATLLTAEAYDPLLEHWWPAHSRKVDCQIADRLRWTILNRSIRVGFADSLPKGWEAVGCRLSEHFNRVPVCLDDRAVF